MPALDLWRVNEGDRAYCIVSNGIALILRHVEGPAPRIHIKLSTIEDDCFAHASPLGKISGVLGLLHLTQETFVVTVDNASHVGSLTETESVSKIQAVSFHCLSSRQYDSTQYELSPGDNSILEPPYAGISKILTNGQFYFSADFDLSSRLGARVKRTKNDTGHYDGRFLWNSYMLDSLLGFRSHLTSAEGEVWDRCQFLVMAIQGYCGVYETMINDSKGSSPLNISVISRLGWHRAGTRFNTRGIDDDGNVANFVETETIVKASGLRFSYIQIRGSVPLFWEQQGVQPFATKLQLTRPQVASQPAFDRHFNSLLETYPRVHVMNLLGTKDQEALLTQAYESHLRQLLATDETLIPKVEMTNFDFHARSRAGGLEMMVQQIQHENRIVDASEDFSCCMVSLHAEKAPELLSFQHGVFRTNCLDCLDRTNVIQDILSRVALTSFLRNAQPDWVSSEYFWTIHRTLWAENGDALARIYAGTGALNTSFTRSGKRTLAGVVADVSKSVNRLYQSNFADAGKQQSIDELLGNLNNQQKVTVFDPLHDKVNAELLKRKSEYSSEQDATIWVGTFNLNGKPPSEDLLPWFFPDPSVEPDIMVVGFQEIVQLTAGQIVATDPEKKRRWEAYITQLLSNRTDAKSTYVILRSEQLVGTALIVIVKTSDISKIRNVEASTKKTGLKGMAGNKGGIGIRLDYLDSSFCFVTAHFAAGTSNVDERDHDYQTINSGLTFRRGRPIESHEWVLLPDHSAREQDLIIHHLTATLYGWASDFNYRVGLPSADARAFAETDQYDLLLQHDQLYSSMTAKLAFEGYLEAPITFRPTYKYDVNSDIYDSSDKQRTPSWTDRILYKGTSLDIQRYSRAEIRLSDHRPVMGVFRVKIKVIDKEKQDKIAQDLLGQMVSANPKQAGVTPLILNHLASDLRKLILLLTNDSEYTTNTWSSTAPPSDESQQPWWSSKDNPDGIVKDEALWRNAASGNPFESKPAIKRKQPPPVPTNS